MTEIRCASGVDLLMDYLEGAVSPELRTAIEAHVSACPRCVAFIKSYSETPRIIRESLATTMPPDLQVSLRNFLREQGAL
jgi:anti-sigma factor RsiW